MFFHIINHFSPPGVGPHLEASTVFSASLAIRSPLVATVLVVDGSAHENPALAAALRGIGAEYCHAGRALAFAEGFNFGIAHSDQPWTILCANDIYPAIEVFEQVWAAAKQGLDPAIGCVIPFLSYADLEFQEAWELAPLAPCTVPLMTLNFNAFPTDYLRSIGGVPTEFSGAYNDVMMAFRIKQDGRRILMAQACCLHMTRLTLDSGTTMVDFEADFEHFAKSHPDLYLQEGYWDLDLAKFVTSRLPRFLAHLLRYVPKSRRRTWARRFLWSLPRLEKRIN